METTVLLLFCDGSACPLLISLNINMPLRPSSISVMSFSKTFSLIVKSLIVGALLSVSLSQQVQKLLLTQFHPKHLKQCTNFICIEASLIFMCEHQNSETLTGTAAPHFNSLTNFSFEHFHICFILGSTLIFH